MEATGAALQRVPIGAGLRRSSGEPSKLGGGRRARVSARPSGAFADDGYVRYYVSPARCGGKGKEEKKRAKLVKGLSRDLSAFYSMGFGVEDRGGLMGEVKGKMISEAADLLLTQLKQLRAEAKEMKRKKKQEKAAMKASRMKDRDEDDTSSSSSSESSDSDCGTVVKVSNLRSTDLTEARPNSQEIPVTAPVPGCSSDAVTLKLETGNGIGELELNKINLELEQECSISSSCSNSAMVVQKPMDKIEVCMGGKCKKSGAVELLQELERKVCVEGAVVGCKCMGKCRDGPNIRVVNQISSPEGDPVNVSRNPLCVGVGLEDVGTIVAKFFGENKDVGLMAA